MVLPHLFLEITRSCFSSWQYLPSIRRSRSRLVHRSSLRRMKFQAGNKDDDYDLGEDEDQPESEDNDLEQKRESLTRVFPVITLISVCTFSILFFIHFLRCWQGEFVQQSLKFYFWEEQRKNTLIKWSFSGNFWNQLGVCLRWTGIPFCLRKEIYCDVIFPPLNFI